MFNSPDNGTFEVVGNTIIYPTYEHKADLIQRTQNIGSQTAYVNYEEAHAFERQADTDDRENLLQVHPFVDLSSHQGNFEN